MLLITNLKSDDKRLGVAVVKVYLRQWGLEEFYRFKKQQFGFENLRVRSLKSIRNLDLMLTVAVGYVGFISEKKDERIAVMQLIEQSKRIYGVKQYFICRQIDDTEFITFFLDFNVRCVRIPTSKSI